MRIYISGPITGNTEYVNDFQKAEEKVIQDGFAVINPAGLRHVMPNDADHNDYMKICLALLELADAIYLLPGWEKSQGACTEYGFAIAKEKVIFAGEAETSA